MYQIDLNCDLGESFGSYRLGMDEAILPLITSANVACGFHAGDHTTMARTAALCAENRVAIGAHPGFPDLQGFGRRDMRMTPSEVRSLVTYQIGALEGFCRANGLRLQHVKPHGALYNMAARDSALAEAICLGIRDFDRELILLGLSGSEMLAQARRLGLRCAAEVFADRAYEEDGTLVSRRKPGALITDEELAVKRVIRMVLEHKVTAVSGSDIEIIPDSVCVHGDGEKALTLTKKLRAALEGAGIVIRPLC